MQSPGCALYCILQMCSTAHSLMGSEKLWCLFNIMVALVLSVYLILWLTKSSCAVQHDSVQPLPERGGVQQLLSRFVHAHRRQDEAHRG